MFCQKCEADVAAGVSADGKSLQCTACGTPFTSRPASGTQSARDLLDKWSAEDDFAEMPLPPARHSRPDGQPEQPVADPPPRVPPAQRTPGPASATPPVPSPPSATTEPRPPALPAEGDSSHDGPAPSRAGRVMRTDAGGTIPAPKMRTSRHPAQRPESQSEGQGGVATQNRPPQNRPPAQNPGTPPHAPKSPVQTPNASGNHTPGVPSMPPEVARQIQELRRRDAERATDSAITDAAFEDSNEPTAPRHPAASPTVGPEAGRRNFRVDTAHTRPSEGGPPIPPPHRRPAPAMPGGHRLDAAEEPGKPHFDTSAFVPEVDGRTGRAESLTGQVLAYLGVGLLTVGTAVLLWGYFGGPVAYTPTGWLVATVGQMVLLLGVVTLISGGMQQTTHQVSTHVAYLNDRLERIEHSTELALNGPYFRNSQSTVNGRTASVKSGESA